MVSHEVTTLGGGCFWCLEAVFQRVNGISKVVSGYSGGHIDNPTAEQVYLGNTGHAEVTQVYFDPYIIPYSEILEIFYTMHDPTTLNRQGYDVGEEYRSVIFYHSNQQKVTAEDITNNFASDLWGKKIVTQIQPFIKFWPADEEYQNFYNKNPKVGYCQIIINPKVQKLRKEFADKLKRQLH